MKITALRQQKKHRERLNVYVDGEFRLSIATELAIRFGLRSGVDVDEPILAAAVKADAEYRAKEASLRLLAHRPRSEHEIRQRLRTRGFEAPAIDSCLQHLKGVGLLDDEAFSLAYCRDRLRSRPSGRTRLLAELRSKGVDAEVANRSLDEVFRSEGVGEEDLARRAVRKFVRRRNEDPIRVRRRFYVFLSRRGFSPETVVTILEEVLG
jgi:regulatory protein